MPVIKPTCIQDLKLRVNIVDVVSRTVTLRKAGGRFKGLCPFHNEKTPSFHVDPDKGFFKCFGCGKAGDMQIEGAKLAGIYNMGGTAVANYVSILERIK